MNNGQIQTKRFVGGCGVPAMLDPQAGIGGAKLVEDNISSRLGELDSILSETQVSVTRLADSLAGSEAQDPNNTAPCSSDVLGRLVELRRIANEIRRQVERANRAVGS